MPYAGVGKSDCAKVSADGDPADIRRGCRHEPEPVHPSNKKSILFLEHINVEIVCCKSCTGTVEGIRR